MGSASYIHRTMAEVVRMRDELERRILTSLCNFERDTGQTVSDLRLTRVSRVGEAHPELRHVAIDLALPSDNG